MALAFVLAVAATIFFGVRAGRQARHIRERNEDIRGWMSVPFIAHSRHVHEEPLFRAIGVAPNRRDHRPIRDIAHEERVPVRQLIGELETAIAQEANAQKESSPPR